MTHDKGRSGTKRPTPNTIDAAHGTGVRLAATSKLTAKCAVSPGRVTASRVSRAAVESAMNRSAVDAFNQAASMRAAAVQSMAAAIRLAAEATRLAGGDAADTAQAIAATHRTISAALAGAVAAETANVDGGR